LFYFLNELIEYDTKLDILPQKIGDGIPIITSWAFRMRIFFDAFNIIDNYEL